MMKYFVGIIVAMLVAGGVFLGFNMGKNNSDDGGDSTNSTNTSTTSSKNTKTLDLSGKGLTEVGSDIYSKTDTTQLILSDNNIKTLPSEMGKMTKVTVFKIDHNVLEGSLIGEIRQMAQLKELDVSYNNMTGMPAEIGQLNQLETLNYSYNNITGLPNELANLKNNLKEFNLTGNPINDQDMAKLRAALPNTNIIF